MWFGSIPSQKQSSPLVSIDQLVAELKLPSRVPGRDAAASINADAIQKLLYPLVKDRDHDLKQNSLLKDALHQLADTMNREYQALQSARGISNREERVNIVRDVASRIDDAFNRAINEGLTTTRVSLASSATDDPSHLQRKIREQYSELEELYRNVDQTISARLNAYALQVIDTTKLPHLKDDLKTAMKNLVNITPGNPERVCPEWHLADDTLAALPSSQTTQVQMLEQILPLVTEAVIVEREAAKLGARYEADWLRGHAHDKLKCADLSGAMVAAKALQLCKNPNPEDLTILAGIYRRMGLQALEFHTLRAMFLGQGIGSASDYSRLAQLTAEIGVHSTVTKGFIEFLGTKSPPDSLYLDLLCEIAILSGDAQLLNDYRHLLQHGSQLSKARLALHDKNWSIAGDTASSTYLDSYSHPKASILEQRALSIAAQAAFMREGARGITHNAHPAMTHIDALLTYECNEPEAISLLQRLSSNSFFAQKIKELNTSNPTYDTLILAGRLALAAKDTKTASARFDDAKGKDPSRAEAYCALATLVEDTDPNTALSLFRHALALSPAYSAAREGISRYAKRQTAQAEMEKTASLTINPLEKAPADLLDQITQHFLTIDPRATVVTPEQVADYLQRNKSAFREILEMVQPGARIYTWGADLSKRILELSSALHGVPHGGTHAWKLLVAHIRRDFGLIPDATSSAVKLPEGLEVAARLAKALDPKGEVLKSPEAHSRIQAILSPLQAIAKRADAFKFGSPEWQAEAEVIRRTFVKVHAEITALTEDVGHDAQRLTEWSARLAETISGKLKSRPILKKRNTQDQGTSSTPTSAPKTKQSNRKAAGPSDSASSRGKELSPRAGTIKS